MNLGILTGADTGIWVLDVDPRHGGNESLAALEMEIGKLPATVSAATGGGGTHYLFRIPTGVSIKNSASKIGAGLDVRGDGGLIVVAPSRTTGDYSWK
jgi:hypothetical protein